MPYIIPGTLTLFTTARAGSHAITNAVRALGAEQYGRHHGGYHCDDTFPRHLVANTLRITNIRSHYDILARWRHFSSHAQRHPEETAAQFIRWFHANGPTDHTRRNHGILFQHAPHCDLFVRAERMTEDFATVCRRIGRDPIPVPRQHETPGLPPDFTRQTFDAHAIDTLRELYGEEMRQFGYYDPPWDAPGTHRNAPTIDDLGGSDANHAEDGSAP